MLHFVVLLSFMVADALTRTGLWAWIIDWLTKRRGRMTSSSSTSSTVSRARKYKNPSQERQGRQSPMEPEDGRTTEGEETSVETGSN